MKLIVENKKHLWWQNSPFSCREGDIPSRIINPTGDFEYLLCLTVLATSGEAR
jgi:hypothetical protein